MKTCYVLLERRNFSGGHGEEWIETMFTPLTADNEEDEEHLEAVVLRGVKDAIATYMDDYDGSELLVQKLKDFAPVAGYKVTCGEFWTEISLAMCDA